MKIIKTVALFSHGINIFYHYSPPAGFYAKYLGKKSYE